MPASKLPAARPSSKKRSRESTSPPVTGRRNARRAIDDRISVAQARSSSARRGAHVKTARRLGVSATVPATRYGPPISTERTAA